MAEKTDMTADELLALIGDAPDGSHPDEWLPRDKTWHAERLNWIREVEALRAMIAGRADLLVAIKRAANAIAAASSHVPSTMNKQMDLAWSTAQDAIAKAEALAPAAKGADGR
jgi:hypothetical protein